MEQIGRYQILGELGRGAMGLVYKAQDPTIGRTVAIKSIRILDLTSEADRERLRERLVREAQSAGILSHPNIVTIYDIAEENGTAYIFMEFVPGQPFEKMLLAAQPPDGETILSILRQTAAALDYAHRKGIVHRDIKPANIMIHEDGSAKITDFGVAKIMSQQLTQAGTMMGTPSYMSPEQVEGTTIDGRADQFGLAVIVYEVLTGEKPFVAEYLPTLLYKIVREEPVPASRLNNTLGPAVDAVIRKAMSKLPQDRYENCIDFVAALSAACNAAQAWVPLPRGVSHNLPTAGSGEHTADASANRSGAPVVSAAETIADEPSPAIAAAATDASAMTYAPPNPPRIIDVPRALPPPEWAPEWEMERAPEWAMQPPPIPQPPPEPPALPRIAVASAPEPAPVSAYMPESVTAPVGRRLASDPLAESGSGNALRNVILAAAAVALLCVGAFVAVQHYNAEPPTNQLVPVPDPGSPAIPPPPPVTAQEPPPATPDATGPDSTSTPDANKPPEVTATPSTTPGITPTPESGTHPQEKAEKAPEKTPRTTAKATPPTAEKTKSPARTAAAAESTFQLTTTPSGATAVFDGDRNLQCVTPCKLTLAAGRHTIALRHAGYRDAQRIVEVPQDPGLIVDLTATFGTLSLSTFPPGLTVAIDGQEQARKTPLNVRLSVGRHRVDVQKGSERQTLNVEIQDGEISTKSIDWSQ